MAVIRKYRKGDIESIEFNDIGKKDWTEDDSKDDLENGEAYTIEVGDYKCVVGIELTDNELYYFWFSSDRRINPIYLKYVKAVLDDLVSRGAVWTLSRGGKKQDKMHRFFGATKCGRFERKTLWVRQQKK